MAKIQAQAASGPILQKEASTVGELKTSMGLSNHIATVNGEIEQDTFELSDYEFVTFAPNVKGA